MIFCIILPIKFIINKIIGSNIPLVAKLPVDIIRVIKRGTNIFIKATKLVVVSCTIFTISEKLAKMMVIINIYCV